MPTPHEAGTTGVPVAVDRRSDPSVRKTMSGPAMRSFLNIAEKWRLTIEEQRGLLGWPATSTFHKYKSGDVGTLTFDTLTRISLVLGIFKALHILWPDETLANNWLKLPNSNPLFSGRTPMAYMTAEGGIDAMYRVRRLLDGRRGGWN